MRFRSGGIQHGRKYIRFIYGIYPDGGTAVQSVRFPVEEWTVAQARAWLIQHGMKAYIEPAREE